MSAQQLPTSPCHLMNIVGMPPREPVQIRQIARGEFGAQFDRQPGGILASNVADILGAELPEEG